MQVVYKYPLRVIMSPQEIYLPKKAKFLHVGYQGGENLEVWFQVEADQAENREKREFKVIGTGEKFDGTKYTHLGTTLIGAYVWHLFERTSA